VNSILLTLSVIALAIPDPDWATAGAAGIVVMLAKVWLEAREDARHRDDCATRLADLQASVDALLERGGDASPLPPCGRSDP
jgi:hypothetical protein